MKPLRWLVAVSLIAVLAVFAAPPTRRAAVEQARLVLGITPPEAFLPLPHVNFPVPEAMRRKQMAAYRRVADGHPHDIGIQMAAAVAPVSWSMGEYYKGRVTTLRPLLERYPKSPALYANLLRYAVFALDDGSKEYPALSLNRHWETVEINVVHPLPRVSPKEFDAWAAAGERLDPDNAWFPATRTSGLLMTGRKVAAIAAIKRAGSKSQWKDYQPKLRRGADSLAFLAYGRSDPFLRREIIERSAFFEIEGDWRDNVIPIAQQAERDGKIGQGMQLRRSIWHVARLSRLHGSSILPDAEMASVLAGFATRGLEEPGSVDRKLPPAERKHMVRIARMEHLRRMGYPSDAAWLKREFSDADAVHEVLHRDPKRLDAASSPVVAQTAWSASAALLNAVLWCAVLAGVWARLSVSLRRGKLLALALVACGLVLAWQAWHVLGLLVAYTPPDVPLSAASGLTAAACALGVPMVLATLFALTALIRRRPFRKTTGAWLRASLIPMACVLSLLYVGVSVWGVTPQRAWQEYRAAQLTSEGRYYAHLLGKTWPE